MILRHAGGEFSHYAHLKQGSVRVKAGETVKRGQAIAQLGQTGNTTEPHLHFQLTDGPDPLQERREYRRLQRQLCPDGVDRDGEVSAYGIP